MQKCFGDCSVHFWVGGRFFIFFGFFGFFRLCMVFGSFDPFVLPLGRKRPIVLSPGVLPGQVQKGAKDQTISHVFF